MKQEASKKNEPRCKATTGGPHHNCTGSTRPSAGRGRKEEEAECTGGSVGEPVTEKEGCKVRRESLGRKDKCVKYCWDGVKGGRRVSTSTTC